MKKWYNFETASREFKEALGIFLKANNIYYECSGAGANFHFEILCDKREFDMTEGWLCATKN